jgi:hypothetical protein
VEIGPEGGRRHNSPLKALPSSEGKAAKAPPLGDGRRALLLLLIWLPPLPKYFYLYYLYSYPLVLRKRNEVLKNRKPRIKPEPSELSSY